MLFVQCPKELRINYYGASQMYVYPYVYSEYVLTHCIIQCLFKTFGYISFSGPLYEVLGALQDCDPGREITSVSECQAASRFLTSWVCIPNTMRCNSMRQLREAGTGSKFCWMYMHHNRAFGRPDQVNFMSKQRASWYNNRDPGRYRAICRGRN